LGEGASMMPSIGSSRAKNRPPSRGRPLVMPDPIRHP
jgi:hypothetical protein